MDRNLVGMMSSKPCTVPGPGRGLGASRCARGREIWRKGRAGPQISWKAQKCSRAAAPPFGMEQAEPSHIPELLKQRKKTQFIAIYELKGKVYFKVIQAILSGFCCFPHSLPAVSRGCEPSVGTEPLQVPLPDIPVGFQGCRDPQPACPRCSVLLPLALWAQG